MFFVDHAVAATAIVPDFDEIAGFSAKSEWIA